MNIVMDCSSFSASTTSHNSKISLELNDICFNGNSETIFKQFFKEFYNLKDVIYEYEMSTIIKLLDESEILDSIEKPNIAAWTYDNINIYNINEYIDEDVLKQYVRDVNIDKLLM